MELREVKKLSEWRSIYRLYKTAFPRYEQKPFPLILYMHGKGRADVWVMWENGVFTGLAITLKTKDLVLIDYFAVAAEKRGRGFGGQALRHLQQYYKEKRLFLEIESVYADADNLPERRRRKQFYLRNGMTPMKRMANVFGTPMELLGYGCTVDFEEYRAVYQDNFGKRLASRLKELPHPECE